MWRETVALICPKSPWLALILFCSAAPGSFAYASQRDGCGKLLESGASEKTRGTYQNHNYWFVVKIPDGLTAITSSPPLPNHGVLICLCQGRACNRFIRAEARYDSTFEGSASKLVDREFAYMKEEHGSPRLLFRRVEKLARLPAIHARADAGLTSQEFILALRSVPNSDAGVVYTVTLTTDMDHYVADKAQFDAVVKSFRLLPFN